MQNNTHFSEPRPISLLLDVDGTLLEFASHPDSVLVSRPLIALLDELYALLGASLALVSGRSIASLNRLFLPFAPTAVGLHGLEMRLSGQIDGQRVDLINRLPTDALPPELFNQVLAIAAQYPLTFIENKDRAVAVHHKLDLPGSDRLASSLNALCTQYVPDWIVLPGRQVFEIKPSWITKATAVDRLMALPAFDGSLPIAFGDDVTDLDMFAAVRRHGGLTVSVGPRIAGAGDLHLASPSSSLKMLERIAQALHAGNDSRIILDLLQAGQAQRVG
jgi:trehalose 6-phosphate phosphatase